MPLNSKIYMPFAPVEPPKGKYESTQTMLEYIKKGVHDKSLKRDAGKPPKHMYEHTIEVRWAEDGGPIGKEKFKKK